MAIFNYDDVTRYDRASRELVKIVKDKEYDFHTDARCCAVECNRYDEGSAVMDLYKEMMVSYVRFKAAAMLFTVKCDCVMGIDPATGAINSQPLPDEVYEGMREEVERELKSDEEAIREKGVFKGWHEP